MSSSNITNGKSEKPSTQNNARGTQASRNRKVRIDNRGIGRSNIPSSSSASPDVGGITVGIIHGIDKGCQSRGPVDSLNTLVDKDVKRCNENESQREELIKKDGIRDMSILQPLTDDKYVEKPFIEKQSLTQSKTNRSRNNKSKQHQKNKRVQKTEEDRLSIDKDTQLNRREAEKHDEEAAAQLKLQQELATKAAAARQKAKEEREALLIEARDLLKTILENSQQHALNRKALDPEALDVTRREFENNKKKLKTDLKKCTAFVKKIKSGAAWTIKGSDIQQDIATLNLSRYVEEVVQALLETNIKPTDLHAFTTLSIAMHQRYADFLPSLLPAFWDVVNTPSGDAAKQRRLYVRLLTEFLLNGLIPPKDVKQFVRHVTEWTGANSGYAIQDANLIVAFGRAAGFEVFGITSSSVEKALTLLETEIKNSLAFDQSVIDAKSSLLNEIETPLALSPSLISEVIEIRDELKVVLKQQRAVTAEVSEVLLKHMLGAYATLTTSLMHTHRKLQKLEKRCEHDRLLSGTLSETREKGLKDARMLSESLQKSVEYLSDCLHQQIPTLEDDKDDGNSQSGLGVEVWTKGGEGDGAGEDFGPFDDEETRSFYCDIPDLLATFPPALLGLNPEDIEKKKFENARKYGNDNSLYAVDDDRIDVVAPSSEAQLDAEEEESRREILKVGDKKEESVTAENENQDTPHYRLTMLLDQELPECHRREQIDAIVEKFCSTHGSSKNSRKRLLKTLFLVPHTRLDLLPYYARMAATVDRIWVDISSNLVVDLEQQFHGQAKFKKNQNIDSRMKTARYIGELIKFRVAPPMVALRCLQRCIEDFTGSNVDVACCLLESCGRFLYRTKHASSKILTLMDTMNRLGKAKNLDDRLQSLLKAAYCSVKPPPSGPRRKAKEYPPLEGYLRHLLLERLDATESSVVFITKQLVRFPWTNPSAECGSLVCRIMLKACRKGRYRTIKAIAAVAAKLKSQRAAGEATVRLVDAVIEELRWALEHPSFRDQQRVMTYTRLLGELHFAGVITGQVVIDQLFDFINLGHEIPDSLREVSKKMVSTNLSNVGTDFSVEKIKIYHSAGGVNPPINEDEELEETELNTKEITLTPQVQPVAVSMYSMYDPRVPSALDPPTSFYRITLVCCLLEVVAKSIVSRSTFPRLKDFMTAFQRYLFTKDPLPTDIEFALLDTFDILDSHWKRISKGSSRALSGESHEVGFERYMTWLQAHNATVANEEADAIYVMQKRTRLERISDESKAMVETLDDIDGHSLQDDDSIMDDDDDDDDTLSISAKESVDGHSDEIDDDADLAADDNDNDQLLSTNTEKVDLDTYNDGESDDDERYGEMDEEAYLRQMQEEAFERELRRITMDALEKGKNASRKQVGETMIAGSQVIKKKDTLKSTEALQPTGLTLGGKIGITFQLLKKGNKGKVEAKELLVPLDTNLALVAAKQDDAAARERDEIKQRVLRYEAESAEAEYTGGNVYLEQEKLQVIRNRPLSMDEIDRNFGTSGGNLRVSQGDANRSTTMSADGRGRQGRGNQSRGRGGVHVRGGRSNFSGRTLFG